MKSLILHTAIRIVMPLLLFFSVFLLVRGHNRPGGGFVAGLVAAASWALYAVAHDAPAARQAFRIDPRVLIGVGLGVILLSGVAGLLAGRPFLAGMWLNPEFAASGEVVVGTPLIFDTGVYLAVVGVVLTIIFVLEEE
ncbi:MAG: Na+/H+ antiporter subunit B [Acidobacteria bacterium]|nr:Na+/H+ antiporter subunit B [Acidobacteriota bacterium]